MMALEKNNKDETEEISQTSEALKTEEILSLLSKTKQDFIKDLEFSNNISNLFKKTVTGFARFFRGCFVTTRSPVVQR